MDTALALNCLAVSLLRDDGPGVQVVCLLESTWESLGIDANALWCDFQRERYLPDRSMAVNSEDTRSLALVNCCLEDEYLCYSARANDFPSDRVANGDTQLPDNEAVLFSVDTEIAFTSSFYIIDERDLRVSPGNFFSPYRKAFAFGRTSTDGTLDWIGWLRCKHYVPCWACHASGSYELWFNEKIHRSTETLSAVSSLFKTNLRRWVLLCRNRPP